MTYEQILYEVEDRIATITLNRPGRLNAFTAKMLQEMVHALERISADDRVRAVIVTGAGRAFCAGADLAAGGGTFDHSEESTPASQHRDGGGLLTLAQSIRLMSYSMRRAASRGRSRTTPLRFLWRSFAT